MTTHRDHLDEAIDAVAAHRAGLGAQLIKLSSDAVVQRDIDETVRTSTDPGLDNTRIPLPRKAVAVRRTDGRSGLGESGVVHVQLRFPAQGLTASLIRASSCRATSSSGWRATREKVEHRWGPGARAGFQHQRGESRIRADPRRDDDRRWIAR